MPFQTSHCPSYLISSLALVLSLFVQTNTGLQCRCIETGRNGVRMNSSEANCNGIVPDTCEGPQSEIICVSSELLHKQYPGPLYQKLSCMDKGSLKLGCMVHPVAGGRAMLYLYICDTDNCNAVIYDDICPRMRGVGAPFADDSTTMTAITTATTTPVSSTTKLKTTTNTAAFQRIPADEPIITKGESRPKPISLIKVEHKLLPNPNDGKRPVNNQLNRLLQKESSTESESRALSVDSQEGGTSSGGITYGSGGGSIDTLSSDDVSTESSAEPIGVNIGSTTDENQEVLGQQRNKQVKNTFSENRGSLYRRTGRLLSLSGSPENHRVVADMKISSTTAPTSDMNNNQEDSGGLNYGQGQPTNRPGLIFVAIIALIAFGAV